MPARSTSTTIFTGEELSNMVLSGYHPQKSKAATDFNEHKKYWLDLVTQTQKRTLSQKESLIYVKRSLDALPELPVPELARSSVDEVNDDRYPNLAELSIAVITCSTKHRPPLVQGIGMIIDLCEDYRKYKISLNRNGIKATSDYLNVEEGVMTVIRFATIRSLDIRTSAKIA